MLVSRKRNASNSPELTLNGTVLEPVPSFKYLGLHSHPTCLGLRTLKTNAHQLGSFWVSCTDVFTNMLMNALYDNYTFPMFAHTWNMQHLSGIRIYERTVTNWRILRIFTCKIAQPKDGTWPWATTKHDWFTYTGWPKAEPENVLHVIIHDLSYFPPNIIVPKSTRTYTGTLHTFQQPFARTNSFFYSFVPHSISQCNALPEVVVSAPSLSIDL